MRIEERHEPFSSSIPVELRLNAMYPFSPGLIRFRMFSELVVCRSGRVIGLPREVSSSMKFRASA